LYLFVQNHIDKGSQYTIEYIDFSKDFDTVSHKKLKKSKLMLMMMSYLGDVVINAESQASSYKPFLLQPV